MDCITISSQEFYKFKCDDINKKVKEKMECVPKYEPKEVHNVRVFAPKHIPKHLNEFKNVNKCYKRELNSLINKINDSNMDNMVDKIMKLITKDNSEYIIKTLIEKSYNEANYMKNIIHVLQRIKDSEYQGDVYFYLSEFFNLFMDDFVNKLEDIEFLSASTAYDDFCTLNKKKKALINYGLCIFKMIDGELIEYTKKDYFEFLFYKLCEYIDSIVYNEIIVEMLIQFIELENNNNYYKNTFCSFYTKKISQKFNQKTNFRIKDIL